MEATYNYILQSGLCLLLFYVFYMLVLRTFPRTGFSRLYLLLVPLLAIVIPLIELPIAAVQHYLPAVVLPEFVLPEVIVTAHPPQQTIVPESIFRLSFMLTIVYATVAAVLLIRLGRQLLELRQLAKDATIIQGHNTEATILQTEKHATFAFLNYIFLNQQTHLSELEQKQVLAHELAHVRLGHSYDVLYYEVLTALLWFNPLVWLLKAELRDVHEYQADAAVTTEYQPDVYTSLLAKEALYRTGIPVGHHFYKPQVFKRLRMLQKRNEQTTLVRPLLAVPLLLLMVFFFSAKDVTADMVERLAKPVAKQFTEPSPATTTPQPEPETATGPLVATPETIAPERYIPKPAEKPAPEKSQPPAKQEPYSYVEQMPSFEGGEVEMHKFIARSIRYPQTTKEAGLEGLVVASFVIETDGSLSDITILKGLDEAADQETRRVIESMSGKWQPGMQNGQVVPVRYTIPMRFALIN
ncbi:M56 family metallopeptidase [Pontibacter burrus]|uniref:TonB family protein n=1 Tax=Pontibacter burrus TaxID=2704466 RepID=A0A6B3LU96_9BACT|nr:M56 family metallopeptidase [Pontibacter burrus]NEM98575.1 TonB family protein [Pontibacter burrus]